MTFNDFLVVGIGSITLLVLFLLAPVVYAHRAAIVSIVSSLSARASEEGRARRAYRQRVYDMSNVGSSEIDPGAGIGAGAVVPRQQHQVALELVPSFETVKTYLTDHTLTDDEMIELLALARRSSGDDLLSANKIRDIVGGNEGKVKAHVAAYRKPRPKPKAAQRMERPKSGWGYEN